MAGIKETVDKKALKDLEYIDSAQRAPMSNIVEPTAAMIDAAIAMLRGRKPYIEIKRAVKTAGNKKMTYGQIVEIHKAMDDRIQALKPIKPMEL